MRLKQHINEAKYDTASRSVAIDPAEGIELIKKECKSSLKSFYSGRRVFRGLDMTSPIAFIQPSKHVRVSANTINLYTIILDNIKSWSSYPKRSQSIVCSTSYSYARGYGSAYVVLPKDGFKFGVCPFNDIWNSFNYIGNLMLFNNQFVDFVKSLDISVKWDRVKTFADLKSVFDMIDKIIGKKGDTFFEYVFMDGYKGDMMDHLNHIFDPKKNRFKMISSIDDLPKEECEIWTDSDCYLIRHDSIGML